MIYQKHDMPYGTVNLLVIGKKEQTGLESSVESYKELLFSETEVNKNNIFLLHQIHGDMVLDADDYDGAVVKEGDGLFTSVKNRVLVIKTADCVPVFLWSKQKPFVAIIHSGWKGLVSGITETFLQSHPDDYQAFAGPCISMKEYEVGEDVSINFSGSAITKADKNNKCNLGLIEHLKKMIISVIEMEMPDET